ncbi:uncharacterized protein A4U43_C04F210 [Asparagus officinalis]|uniref:Methyltransferase domain-containing protein n=1 Tax=Asparagus officinalis TaxID=4686 RepID=A0A5P1EXM1_ASPOF|nr:uncharacterized protein A4U43_C04F210 [Asparagus officinalis]
METETEAEATKETIVMMKEDIDRPSIIPQSPEEKEQGTAAAAAENRTSGGIHYKSAKKKKRMAVAFVVFENVEQVKDAIKILNEKSDGGKQIKIANATRRSNEKRRASGTTQGLPVNEGHDEDNDAADNDTSVTEGLVPKTRSARDVVTPLAHMPYPDQLEHKKNSLLQTLKRLTRNARKACPDAIPLPEWILKSREIGGLPCKFEGIMESPVVDGYRNKCEFSVGYSLQGKRTVGFMLGNFREGVTAVEEPVNCPNVSRISCKYAVIFQNFLQSSVFPVWDRINNTGFWRQFTVREGRNPGQADLHENPETQIAEVMLIIQVCSLDVADEQMKIEFTRMAQAFAQGAASCSPPLPLTTIVVQDHKGISNAAPADCPLLSLPIPNMNGDSSPGKSGAMEARIHDYISNLRFSLSPTAFFQVNTLAAERLYSLAGDWAELCPDTLLFDICCGTGTIGLTLAHRVGMVIGVEMNESAVEDAQRNAQINSIDNCKFVCGKAEDVIGALLREYLGVAQQRGDASAVSGSNNVKEDANGSNSTKTEKLLVDEDAPVDAHAANSSVEVEKHLCERSITLGVSENLDGENTTNSNKDCDNNDSIADESSNHEIIVTNSSTNFLKSCTECRPASQGNKECTDVNQDILKFTDTNKQNGECKETSHDGHISEEKGIKDAPACHFKDIVAIVDPPRVGLHPTVIKALRTHPRIRRLVYISCNPESLVANAIELCTPTSDKSEKGKGNRGWRSMSAAGLARHRTKSMPSSEPFRPVRAMAVDLFPHTPHCEMVMLLER